MLSPLAVDDETMAVDDDSGPVNSHRFCGWGIGDTTQQQSTSSDISNEQQQQWQQSIISTDSDSGSNNQQHEYYSNSVGINGSPLNYEMDSDIENDM
jgi:hypothetical protein